MFIFFTSLLLCGVFVFWTDHSFTVKTENPFSCILFPSTAAVPYEATDLVKAPRPAVLKRDGSTVQAAAALTVYDKYWAGPLRKYHHHWLRLYSSSVGDIWKETYDLFSQVSTILGQNTAVIQYKNFQSFHAFTALLIAASFSRWSVLWKKLYSLCLYMFLLVYLSRQD